jgi:hypothetical protein
MADITSLVSLGICVTIICIIVAIVAYFVFNDISILPGFLGGNNDKCRKKYGEGLSLLDNIFADGSNCFVCKDGHQDRTIYGVTTDQACEGDISKILAARIKDGTLESDDSGKIFADVGAAIIGICPDLTGRNDGPITSDTPCQGKCEDLYPGSFRHKLLQECYSCPDGGRRNANLPDSGKECNRECEVGMDQDPNGSCYKCPDGYTRTLNLNPVDSPEACHTAPFGKTTSAIFGSPWLYPWKKEGNMNTPLKFKESNFASAELLGQL